MEKDGTWCLLDMVAIRRLQTVLTGSFHMYDGISATTRTAAFCSVFEAMPNGFRHDVMLWRLVLRVDAETDDSISLRIAARQAHAFAKSSPLCVKQHKKAVAEPSEYLSIQEGKRANSCMGMGCRPASITPRCASLVASGTWFACPFSVDASNRLLRFGSH